MHKYTCIVCNGPVTQLPDGAGFSRTCGHDDKGVGVQLSAVLYGEGHVASAEPNRVVVALKVVFSLLKYLLGRRPKG